MERYVASSRFSNSNPLIRQRLAAINRYLQPVSMQPEMGGRKRREGEMALKWVAGKIEN